MYPESSCNSLNFQLNLYSFIETIFHYLLGSKNKQKNREQPLTEIVL